MYVLRTFDAQRPESDKKHEGVLSTQCGALPHDVFMTACSCKFTGDHRYVTIPYAQAVLQQLIFLYYRDLCSVLEITSSCCSLVRSMNLTA